MDLSPFLPVSCHAVLGDDLAEAEEQLPCFEKDWIAKTDCPDIKGGRLHLLEDMGVVRLSPHLLWTKTV